MGIYGHIIVLLILNEFKHISGKFQISSDFTHFNFFFFFFLKKSLFKDILFKN